MTASTPGTSFSTRLNRLTLSSILAIVPLAGHAAEVKVAFTGDQGTTEFAVEVLRLVADEGADLLMLQGDFGYFDNTAMLWDQQLTEQLGKDFPVLSVVGNHENFEWLLYQQLIAQRIARVDDLDCTGNIGVKSTCTFRGLHITQVASGVKEVGSVAERDDYPGYISETLGNSPSKWRLCSWHKNQAKMQTGRKADEAGWPIYQACLAAGGIAATAHEHAYSRTYLMDDFENQSVVHRNDTLEIKPGQSIAFVSGLGGNSIRGQVRNDNWWASVYTADQGANYGALFCTFADDTADCYFKSINGAVPDRFTLKSEVLTTTVPASAPMEGLPDGPPGAPPPLGSPDPVPGPDPVPDPDPAAPTEIAQTSSSGNAAMLLGVLLLSALCRRRRGLPKLQ